MSVTVKKEDCVISMAITLVSDVANRKKEDYVISMAIEKLEK